MADDNLTLDAILAASDRLLGFTPDTSEWVRNNPQEVEWAKRSVVMHDKPGDRAELVAIELGAMWVASLIQTDILRSVDSVFDDSIWDAKNTKQMFKDWIGTHPQAVTDARDEINPNVTTYDVAGMTQQLWSQWIDENENYQDIIAIQKEIAAEQATKPLQVETEEEMLARKHVEYAGVVAPKFWQELGVGIQPEEQRTNDTIDLPATQDIPPVPRNYELLLQNVRDELAQGSEQNINQNMLNVLQSLGNVGVTDQDILNWQQRNPQVGLSDATPYEILKVLSKQHDGDTLAIWRTFKPSLREQKYETPAKTEDFKDEDAITEMLNADSQTALSDSENTPQKRQEFREWLQNNPEAVKNSYSNFESGVMDRDLYTRLAVADLRERWIANTRTQEIGAVDMATDTQLLTEEYPYISNEILPGMEDALNEIAWGGQQNATQEQQEFRKWVNNHPNLLPENVDNFDRNAAKDLVLHLHEQWVAQKSGTLAEDGDVAMVTYRVIAMHANIDDTPGRQNDEPVESAVLKTQTEILQELTEQNGGIAPSDPVLLKALIANESALFAHEFDDRFPEFKHLGLNNKAKVNFMYATLPGHEEPQEMTFDDWEESIAALHCVKEDGSTDHIAFANWLEEHPDAAAAVYNGGVDIADAGMALANLWQASESHQARVAVWVKEDADSDEAMWADQSRAAEAKNLRADEPTLPGKESYDDWYSQIMPEVREKAAFRGPEYIAEFETWLNNNEEIARKAYRIGAWGPVYALDKALLPEWNRSRKDAAETDVENGRQDANSQDFLASSDFSEQEIRNWAKNNPQAVDGNATLNEMLQTLGAMYGSGSLAIAVVKECQVSPDDDATIKAREIGNRPFLSMAEERRAQFSKQDGTDALQSTSRYLGKTAVLQAAMDELNAENTVSSIPKPPKTGGNSRKRPCAKNNRRKHEIKETKGDKRAHTPRATKLNQYYLDALTGLAVPIRGDIAVPEGARVIEQPPGRPAPTLFQFHDSSLLPYGSTIITNYGYSTAAADQTLVHRLGRLTGGVIGRQARQTNLDMIGRSADPDAALRVAITEIGRAAGQDNTLTCPFNELTPSEADRDTLLAAIHQGINAGNTAGTRFADPLPATIVPTTELVGPLVNLPGRTIEIKNWGTGSSIDVRLHRHEDMKTTCAKLREAGGYNIKIDNNKETDAEGNSRRSFLVTANFDASTIELAAARGGTRPVLEHEINEAGDIVARYRVKLFEQTITSPDIPCEPSREAVQALIKHVAKDNSQVEDLCFQLAGLADGTTSALTPLIDAIGPVRTVAQATEKLNSIALDTIVGEEANEKWEQRIRGISLPGKREIPVQFRDGTAVLGESAYHLTDRRILELPDTIFGPGGEVPAVIAEVMFHQRKGDNIPKVSVKEVPVATLKQRREAYIAKRDPIDAVILECQENLISETARTMAATLAEGRPDGLARNKARNKNVEWETADGGAIVAIVQMLATDPTHGADGAEWTKWCARSIKVYRDAQMAKRNSERGTEHGGGKKTPASFWSIIPEAERSSIRDTVNEAARLFLSERIGHELTTSEVDDIVTRVAEKLPAAAYVGFDRGRAVHRADSVGAGVTYPIS